MSTIISSFGSGSSNLSSTSLSVSATAVAGDLILLHVVNYPTASAGTWSDFTWNGQILTVISSLGLAGTTKTTSITVAGVATTSGTFNITASKTTTHDFAYLGHVVRSTKGFLGLPAAKTQIWDTSASGSLGSYAAPSIVSDTLGTNGRVIDFCGTLGYSNAFADVRPTTATAAGSTAINTTTHTSARVNTIHSSTATGTTTVTTGYTHTDAASNQPNYYFIQVAIRELEGDVSFFANKSVWTAANTASSFSTVAPPNAQSMLLFISSDAAITGTTVNPASVQVNGVAATQMANYIVSSDGNGVTHWVYRYDNIVPGVSYTVAENVAAQVHQCVVVFACSNRPVLITAGTYARATSAAPVITATTVAGDSVLFGLTMNNISDQGLSRSDNHYILCENGDATKAYNGVTVKEATGTTTTATFAATSSQKWSGVGIIVRRVTQAPSNILLRGWARNTASPKYDGAAINGGH